MTYDDLYKLEHNLQMISGVQRVEAARPVPGELRLLVVLHEFDWDVRRLIVDLVDDFARDHLHEVTATVDITNGSHATSSTV